MADKAPPDPALVANVLAAAAVASGGDRNKAAALIPDIVIMMAEGARERAQVEAMLAAPVLTGKFLGYKLHDGNQRCLVTFQAENREVEDFWSERTDKPHGAAQLKLLQAYPKGCPVRIWKGLRQIDQTKKVRDMLHIQRVDADPITESRQSEGPGAPPPERPSTAQSPPESTGGSDSGGQQSQVVLDYSGALERLKGGQRVALARWAHETMKVSSLYDENLTADQKNSILAHCELIAQGMA